MSAEGPKVSIIVPTFNAGATLARCLQSISLQTYMNREVLVIDGGSTDNTLEVANEYTKRCVTFIQSRADRGVYDAMNQGIGVASGDWLYFMGSDDEFFAPDVVERALDPDSSRYDMIYGDVLLKLKQARYAGRFNIYKLSRQNLCHQAMFCRRELFAKLGLFDLEYRLWADYEWNLRLFGSKTARIKYVDMVIAIYSEQGMTASAEDSLFNARRKELLRRHLGVPNFRYYRQKVWHKLFQR